MRARLRTHLQLSPLDAEQIDEVVLAVEEACTNAILHSGAERDLEVSLTLEGAELAVVVRDWGRGFDLSRFDPEATPDLLATGGRGLFLMSRLMDVLDLRLHEGLEVRMRKRGAGE